MENEASENKHFKLGEVEVKTAWHFQSRRSPLSDMGKKTITKDGFDLIATFVGLWREHPSDKYYPHWIKERMIVPGFVEYLNKIEVTEGVLNVGDTLEIEVKDDVQPIRVLQVVRIDRAQYSWYDRRDGTASGKPDIAHVIGGDIWALLPEEIRTMMSLDDEGREKMARNHKTKTARKAASALGGKALKGTAKQKTWAEDIRKEALYRLTADLAEKALSDPRMQSAKWWIDNRGKITAAIRAELAA